MSKIYRPIMPMRRNAQGQWVETHNVTSAEKFGQLLTPILPNHVMSDYKEDWIIGKLREGLKGFSNDDFILMNGDPEILALTIKIASNINKGKVKLLKWDKFHQGYIVKDYDFNIKGKGEGNG